MCIRDSFEDIFQVHAAFGCNHLRLTVQECFQAPNQIVLNVQNRWQQNRKHDLTDVVEIARDNAQHCKDGHQHERNKVDADTEPACGAGKRLRGCDVVVEQLVVLFDEFLLTRECPNGRASR